MSDHNPVLRMADGGNASLNSCYLDLLRDWSLWNESLDGALQRIIVAVGTALEASRVSVWGYSENRRSLTMRQLYDTHSRSFSSGTELLQADLPTYFEHLAHGRLIDAADLYSDPRTLELLDVYTKPQQLRALLDITLRLGGKVWGVLCIEMYSHPRIWRDTEKHFALSIADLLSQVINYDALRASEQRLHLITDQLPVGILRTDLEGRCIYVNSQWCELLDCTTAQAQGNWLAAIPEDRRVAMRQGVTQTVFDGGRFDSEFSVVHHLQPRWISCHWVAERNSDGFPSGALGAFFDITRETISLERLREVSTLHQAILENANHAIITSDLNGVITSFNCAAETLLGYSADEMIGRCTPGIFHDRDEVMQRAERLSQEFQTNIKPGFDVFTAKVIRDQRDEHEWTYVRKDGGRVPVSLSISALRTTGDATHEGSISGYLGIAVDLSERNRAAQALLENEQRYRSLFEGSGDALFLMHDDTFIDCNSTTLHIFGCTRGDIIGVTPLHFSPPLQPDGRDSGSAAREHIDAARHGERQHFEWQHWRLDHSLFDAEVTLTSVRIGGGKHLLAAVRDVSARKQAERELLQSYRSSDWKNQVSQQLHNLQTADAIASVTAQLLSAVCNAQLIRLFAVDPRTGLVDTLGVSGPESNADSTPVQNLSHISQLAQLKEFAVIPDVATSPDLPPFIKETLLARGITRVELLPLSHHQQVFGLIVLEYAQNKIQNLIGVDDLKAFGSTVATSLSNARHFAELQYQAEHDSLTQLPNRSVLQRELTAALATAKPLTLMLLDLNHFKEINDTLGHHIGDRLLIELADRLQHFLAGDREFLCRLGGDEFSVLLGDCTVEQGVATARELLAVLQQPMIVNGMTLEVGASIGVAGFPAHGDNYHDLLRAADVAMYAAKNAAQGVAIYTPAQDSNSPERLRLMTELGQAIRNGELEVHYQPKIDLRDGMRVSGFEALVRWQHPREGLLPPSAFMPFAEVSDAIHALTLDVLRQALAQQKIWLAQQQFSRQQFSQPQFSEQQFSEQQFSKQQFSEQQPVTIAVNLSARNLLHANFFSELETVIKNSGADPKLLELEITETSLMQDPATAAAVLAKIAALGIGIAIDDFGTGYSSLAYLRRLPLHALKIDRTFVQELSHNAQDQVIVRSTIALAHNLNLQVIAEGVEDEATLAQLRDMGCDGVQGFLFARPQPAPQIEQWWTEFVARRAAAR